MKKAIILLSLLFCVTTSQGADTSSWLTKSFEDFSKGTFDSAGAKMEKEHPANYVSMRDANFPSGGVGLVTDRSTGAFKNVRIWDKALMIRDLWE